MTVSAGPGWGPALELERRFDASPDTVFDAFTDAERLRRWWKPRDFTVVEMDFPAVEGAEYRVALRAPDGTSFVHVGRFLEVRRARRLCYTWRWIEGPMRPGETLVEIDFRADDDGTRVTVRHRGFPDVETRDAHVGWHHALAALVAELSE